MTAIIPFQDVQGMAQAIAKSGLFGMKTADQALALMLVAQAEGQHPATITQDYDIIQGRAARKTHSVLARFQQMGGTVEWHELSDVIADATFAHKSGGKLRIEWTFEQAKKAGLTAKDNWKNYPRAMLRARCIAEGIRAVYPAALGGMMVSEEAQDLPPAAGEPKQIDPSTGEIRPAPAPKPARAEIGLYPQDRFEANLPKWRALCESGQQTPASIEAMLQSKARLSDDQRRIIAGLGAIDVQASEPEVDQFIKDLE